ncbi:MAG TPA: neutral zinc metallopeptidase [Hyphomicrobiaceae bacterium]|jgi:predicted metalloprotease|nr:neutral zinc metallopeptidase [Hyphomicrobiaceae bacterium]
MRYGDDDRESDMVEDRRGEPGGGPFRRGMPFPLPIGGGGLSLTSLIVIGIICLMLGINPLTLLTGEGIDIPNMPRPQSSPGMEIPGMPRSQSRVPAQNDEMSRFVRRVLADTEDVWTRVFQASGRTYAKPKLVLYDGTTGTRCGAGLSAMGPFYCPLDRTVYVDLSFYDVLKRRFQAPGDFAQAYVIAHEVGHHVQTLLGITEKVEQAKERANDQRTVNALQVRMELQADCLAGVWASLNDKVKSRLEPGDIEEGIAAASAVGDDTLQRQTQGRVVPESFTHGTSSQRVKWFKTGFSSASTQACDTFNASNL